MLKFTYMADRKKALPEEPEDLDEEEVTERKPRSKKRPEPRNPRKLKEETRHTVAGVVFIALAIFFVIAGFGAGGIAGAGVKKVLSYLFGVGYALAPILFAILGINFMKQGRPQIAFMQGLGSIMFLIGTLGLIDLASTPSHLAGVIGRGVAYPFVALFDMLAATLFIGAVLIISLVILFDTRPTLTLFISLRDRVLKWWTDRQELRRKNRELVITGGEEPEQSAPAKPTKPEPIPEEPKEPIKDDEELNLDTPKKAHRPAASYVPPPLSLLATDKGKPNVGDVKANANIIKRSLSNFGIEVEMDEVTIGPSVTRYAFKPAEGVKLSRILGLQNDLSLALAAHPIRIEAPIPGKSLVGIEIPNKQKSMVGLASLLMDDRFQKSEKPLTVALGRSINGFGHMANMAKMPHVLIAGATGSGKSVTIHTFITSLLYRNGPDDLRFIMIDPKRVELTLYNKIPHLLTPVITDAKKAILSLKWAAKEMDRRYDILQKESVRDIDSYHKNILGKNKGKNHHATDDMAPEEMPYIVIIIDELADIMQAYPRELESAIVRLAQMSRAVGIHLLLSTQRPSVNVITGLIKANVPARVALQVASQIDSRTILDQAGAEKLLGAGDMLYLSGEMPQPERLQSAFISEAELKAVVAFIAENNEPNSGDEIAFSGSVSADKNIFESSLEGDGDDDDLYEDARITVIEAGKASTSFLQRKLGIGYARAARLVDILEERGVIGPGSGAKPREVMIKPGEGIMDDIAQ